ncbi:sirohydrochlorin ferrochelatase [Ureibacillus xyleni]|uniref:Sirohydrochlorin ferrochelatase n=1 Tax=Ureibacillus xyleni TaxID=614648 RepID=A0A285S7I3_9BACL|nr:sirohydrochlorin chelatase [Ureibacillus xyleni]SOC03463.1 sirohydrochlorin ferrochelatase [Ureibacillus xyleni]
MKAVLFVAHGTRVKAGIDEAIQFIETVKPFINVDIQELCFLELAEPLIKDGIATCVAKGATNISVIPILLLSANHAKKDIPLEIRNAQKLYPSVSISLGKPFGIHEKLVNSLHERVIAKNTLRDKDVDILLIGRGSSDIQVQNDLQSIAKLLKQKFQYSNVDTCFLYGNGPSFEEALQQINNRNKKVFIIPYILFTGLLKIGVQKKIAKLGFSEDQVVLCECLGYDNNVREVLVERVKEALVS